VKEGGGQGEAPWRRKKGKPGGEVRKDKSAEATLKTFEDNFSTQPVPKRENKRQTFLEG